MSAETRTCRNCHAPFTIEPEDFAFYERMGVPPPTWCPNCQLQRRLTFRNERAIYKRTCDAPGHAEELISVYSADTPVNVYDQKFWWGDGWDAMDYGRNYDFSRPFFEQLKELIREVPWPALYNINAVQSDYCNMTTDNKNCYLVFGGDFNENCSYSTFNFHSRDSMDLYFVNKCELCYEVLDSDACYKTFFMRYSKDCANSAFLYNCLNCQNCFGCVNLRNKSYCMFNEQLTKEEYERRMKEYDIGSFKTLEEAKAKFAAFKAKFPHRYAEILRSVNSTGDNIFGAKNCEDCFDINGPAEDMKHVMLAGWEAKDARNTNHFGHKSELTYDSFATFSGSQHVMHSAVVASSQHVMYSYNVRGSHDVLGCVGVNKKSYCILNKQYSKEEYEELVAKILKHMDEMPYVDSAGRRYGSGSFLPSELSPFAYNETVAHEYFPLTKGEAERAGYAWKEPEERHYVVTIPASDLPDHASEASEAMLKEVIGCAHEGACNDGCTGAFKITPEELQFYKRMNLALPRLCSTCRHRTRIRQRNPIQLWDRACECGGAQSSRGSYANLGEHFHGGSVCPNSFKTTYAPEREEVVYCEQCYQVEAA